MAVLTLLWGVFLPPCLGQVERVWLTQRTNDTGKAVLTARCGRGASTRTCRRCPAEG